jgi:hypothetical protein
VYRKVYWGSQEWGDLIIPIVINIGASISTVSRIKSDIFDGIMPVEPDLKIHGSLNHVISVNVICAERSDEK